MSFWFPQITQIGTRILFSADFDAAGVLVEVQTARKPGVVAGLGEGRLNSNGVRA